MSAIMFAASSAISSGTLAVPNLNNFSVSDSQQFGLALAGFKLYKNGDLASVKGSSETETQRTNEWVNEADKFADIGNSYEYRVTKTSGNGTLSGITNGVWTTISQDTSGNIATSGSTTITWVGTLEIRNTNLTTLNDTCTITLTVS